LVRACQYGTLLCIFIVHHQHLVFAAVGNRRFISFCVILKWSNFDLCEPYP
jgi:hypothetical protein